MLFKCNIHNIEFTSAAECFMRGPKDIRGKCPQCIEEERAKRYAEQRVELICAYCNQTFIRSKSSLNKSKSGLYFCCREHKDLAQRIENGEMFKEIRPSHYGNGKEVYRDIAFREYSHKCAVCGYDEDVDILQVHHKDSNRNNNDKTNLCILCPNCHAKITYGKYQLTKDFQLKPLK